MDDANAGRGGTALFQQMQSVDRDVDLLFDPARERNVAVLLSGTNDIAGYERTGAQVYEDTRTWCLDRRAKGFTVVVLSMLARRAPQSFEPARQEFLSLLRADHSFADAFIDVAADSRLGAPEAWADSRWFADGVHPTVAGYRLIADLVEPVLLSL